MNTHFIPESIREELFTELAALQDYPSFIDFLDNPTEDNFYRFESDVTKDKDYNFFAGATKGVIVIEECEYVIKIPFLSENNGVNYCMIEADNYIAAVNEGLADCFAITELIEIIEGIPIYAQERADCDEDSISDSMSEASYHDYLDENGWEDTEDARDAFYGDYYTWDGDDRSSSITYQVWTAKIASRFWDFCRERIINDLHAGNWGYINGRFVAVDYSGYGSRVEDAWLALQEEEE